MQRRILRVVPVIIASLALIVSGLAFAGSVRYSKHDFSISSYWNSPAPSQWAGSWRFETGGFIDEVCVFCHTPHAASTDNTNNRGLNTLLWNRTVGQTTYNVYTSSTLTAILSSPPTGISLMCMSCHDGVTSIATNLGAPNTDRTLLSGFTGNPAITFDNSLSGVTNGKIGSVLMGDEFTGWGANIGNLTAAGTVNLSNDHPVSFNWPSGDTGLHDPVTYVKAFYPQLRLYGGANRMECSTCHNVHNPDIRPFLVMSNSQSAMCLACHDK